MNYPKLNPDFKERWIEALSSGKYNQGENSLYEDGNYCCLGVACIVEGLTIRDIERRPYITKSMSSSPSLSVLSKASITSTSDLDYVIAEMNDEKGMSFLDIANWIEKNL